MSNYTNVEFLEDENTSWYKIFHLVKDNSRVLDIGCSSGNLGESLIKEKGCEVIGLDLDYGDVKLAKKKLTDAFVKNIEQDDITSLGKFDYIIFADVIEHLVDPSGVLSKVKKSLNQSGTVLFSIPNMAHMGVRLMLLDGKFEYGETGLLDKTHLHFYDRNEIERVFFDAGYSFDVLDSGLRYIPRNAIKKRLNAVGLTPDEKFYKINEEPAAVTFQYIGMARPSSKKFINAPERAFASPYILSTEEQVAKIQEEHTKNIQEIEQRHHQELTKLINEKHQVLTSTSWRLTKPFRIMTIPVRLLIHKVRILRLRVSKYPYIHLKTLPHMIAARKQYIENEHKVSTLVRGGNAKLAIILHLYYPDRWPMIWKKLKILEKNVHFDLYVTLPNNKADFVNEIMQDNPKAHVINVPNLGRDVLPFISVAKHLKSLGYEYILKLHSKKSLHRADGSEWFADILESLVPESTSIQQDILSKLKKKSTGIIGPKSQYITLRVNFAANSFHFLNILKKLFSKKKINGIVESVEDYGFFAGTMFWARIDALDSILKLDVGAMNFEPEKGHIDATMAHALERIFCVVPELLGKDMFEVTDEGCMKLDYKTFNIPEWSDLHPNYKKPTA